MTCDAVPYCHSTAAPFGRAMDGRAEEDNSRWPTFIGRAGVMVAVVTVVLQFVGPQSTHAEPPSGNADAARAEVAAPIGSDWPQLLGEEVVLEHADKRGTVELFVEIGPGDGVESLLLRAGAVERDAKAVTALIAAHGPAETSQGAEVAILFGEAAKRGGATVERVTLSPDLGPALRIVRSSDGAFHVGSQRSEPGAKALRIRGTAGHGLYWSLRAAGVSAQAASEYVEAISTRLEPGAAVAAGDRFELILAKRPGGRVTSNILYAALDRDSGRDVELVKWKVDDRSAWIDPSDRRNHSSEMLQPVSGRVTSRFGYRVHPILRFGRFHRGVDFQAPFGAPILAASEGRVVAAGWNGGYGRQIRIAHPAGLQTSYSHMSSIGASVGSYVRRGQVIGHVGSTGFSTGAHLHYEVIAGGRPVDPLSARHVLANGLSEADMTAVRTRLNLLLAIEEKRAFPTAGRASS